MRREGERKRESEKERDELTQDSPASIFTVRADWPLRQFLLGIPDQPVLRFVFMIHSCPPRGPVAASHGGLLLRRTIAATTFVGQDSLPERRGPSKLHEIPRNAALKTRGPLRPAAWTIFLATRTTHHAYPSLSVLISGGFRG